MGVGWALISEPDIRAAFQAAAFTDVDDDVLQELEPTADPAMKVEASYFFNRAIAVLLCLFLLDANRCLAGEPSNMHNQPVWSGGLYRRSYVHTNGI